MKTLKTISVTGLALVALLAIQSTSHAQDYEQAARHAKILMAQSLQAYQGLQSVDSSYSGYVDPMKIDDRDVYKQSKWIYENFPAGAQNHAGMVARAKRIRDDVKRLLIRGEKLFVTAANSGDSETKELAYKLLKKFQEMELQAKSLCNELGV